MRPLRRADRLVPDNEALTVLKNGEVGFLATTDVDGAPYVVPLNYVFYDGAVYIHCATEGQKLDNIAANARVCFAVATDAEVVPDKFRTKYKSVIVFGQAEILRGDDMKQPMEALVGKYSREFAEEGKRVTEGALHRIVVIKITPEHICGKESK